ncbi:rhodanese-like domain-containing protein [Alcanivorax quisquiliarum]|uniref:Thiosulfate sulfurtransferase n=1 Tax=Alcanivorax quisquiliarum TaxID=2933565 RepID=A0ABT0E617_9GAMM|nr:rhodanese-like domain-containing protein [Alcanivorax quisquiliarum]MCK0537275.1 thiosulfate sulfurtransferase [Alcanivorax quisquiliarum]
MNPLEISPNEAQALLDDDGTLFVDIRDAGSYASAHIRGAQHLSHLAMDAFLAGTERSKRIVVCCYHGHSSLDAAAFLREQGFEHAVSLTGGFEYWRQVCPDACASAT